MSDIQCAEPTDQDYMLVREMGPSTTVTLRDLLAIGPAAARVFEDPHLADALRPDAPVGEAVRHAARHCGQTLFEQHVGALWDPDRRVIMYFNNHAHPTQGDIIARTIAILETGTPELRVVADAAHPEPGEPDAGYTVAIALAGGAPHHLPYVRHIAQEMLGRGDGVPLGEREARVDMSNPDDPAVPIVRLVEPTVRMLLDRPDMPADTIFAVTPREDDNPAAWAAGASVPGSETLRVIFADRGQTHLRTLTRGGFPISGLRLIEWPAKPGTALLVLHDGTGFRVHIVVRAAA